MRPLKALKHIVARHTRSIGFLQKVRRMIPIAGDRIAFETSDQYWKERYEGGGDSGEGSYGPLARYKADFINGFCTDRNVKSAIEFGCGDGNQASMLKIERYLGIDISEKCVAWAKENFHRPGWDFRTLDDYSRSEKPKVDLGLSLDVIYHLVEDDIYHAYLQNLSGAANRFLLIYASNFEHFDPQLPHVKHRPVVSDMARWHPEWTFVATESNPHAKRHDDNQKYGSFAEFHVFEMQNR